MKMMIAFVVSLTRLIAFNLIVVLKKMADVCIQMNVQALISLLKIVVTIVIFANAVYLQ